MKKIIIITLIVFMLISANVFAQHSEQEINLEIEYTKEASEADKDFINRISRELNDGKSFEKVMNELNFEIESKKIYKFEIVETDGEIVKTGKTIEIEDDEYKLFQNGELVEKGCVEKLSSIVVGDYVTIELQHSRGFDWDSGNYYVSFNYIYDYNSGSNILYKDAYGVAWDTTDVATTGVLNTNNLTSESSGTGWRGYEVDRFSTEGTVIVITSPRYGIPVGEAHGEYMAEYAHVTGFPANWSFSGGLGFVNIGYTTQGTVIKDLCEAYF